jgi:structural maintenance of chromosome 1
MVCFFQLGRMSDLCQPVHERYKLAITKVMGKNLNALIVKNKHAALEVINYLKTLHLPPEIILPLDTIKVYPIQGRLRFVNQNQGLICSLFSSSESQSQNL